MACSFIGAHGAGTRGVREGCVREFLSNMNRVTEACSFIGAHGSGTRSVRKGRVCEFL